MQDDRPANNGVESKQRQVGIYVARNQTVLASDMLHAGESGSRIGETESNWGAGGKANPIEQRI